MKMKSTFRFLVLVASLITVAGLHAAPFGQWEFNSSNLTATVGTALQYADGSGGATELATAFGSTAAFGLPDINGTNAIVMRFPASSNGMGFNMATPAANGRGVFVDNYTIIYDLLFPAASNGKLRPLLETDGGAIVPGADLGVGDGNGIGVIGGTFNGSVATNTWYRIGFVVRTNEVRSYINGTEVGVSTVGGAEADRLVLSPSTIALILANTGVNPAAGGYINSLQLRDEALTARQMQALSGPSAAGIPQVIPPVPSFISKWIPAGSIANRTTEIGVVIDDGDTTILDPSITLKFDNVTMSAAQITRNGDQITVKTNMGTLPLGQHVVLVTYTDSVIGAQTYSNVFTAVLFYEDFDGLTLGTNVDEALPTVYQNVWTKTPPAGWSIDDTGMPSSDPALDGVTEWSGWSFASKNFWGVITDDQDRQLFTKAKGTVAVADPDEWDDGAPHAVGYFNSFMKTPAISLVGVSANTAFLKFDSSWRPEAFDDCGGTEWPACPATNNQTATVTASYNGGAAVQVLKFDSDTLSPTFHPDSQNETVTILLNNPVGATNVVLTFGMTKSGNDWWWAVDNIQVASGPAITTQPVSLVRDAGQSATFTVAASGGNPLTYQWQFNGGTGVVFTNVPGATATNLTFIAETNKAGSYRVVVTDPVGSTISAVATLTVIAAPFITQHPVGQTVNAGSGVSFRVAARGRAPFAYQWQKGGVPIGGATTQIYSIPNAQVAHIGLYRCVVTNSDGSANSLIAPLNIATNITQDLVVHLKFDNDFADASGRGNNATAVGSPTFVAGKIGQGMQWTSARDGSSFNYATLGYPADLHFTSNSPLSISFWFKLDPGQASGDPALVGNKNWGSGNNNGVIIFTTGSLRWSYRELDEANANTLLSNLNTRKDSGGTSINIYDGIFHHCVVTFNRLGRAGTYVDGKLLHVGDLGTANATLGGFYSPTTIDNDPSNARSAGANAWNVGQDGVGTYTDGGGVGITNAVIDDLGIWRRTLTPGEVLAIYTAGNAGNTLTTAAPVTNPRPLDPSISRSGANVAVSKANTVLESAPEVGGPWTEITGARSTNSFVEPPSAARKFYRGSQP